MDWKKKLDIAREKSGLVKDSAMEKANVALDQHWTLVRALWREKVDPSLRAVVMDDEKLKSCLRVVHDALPLPVRFAINEDKFIRVCMNNRDKWLPREDANAADESLPPEPGDRRPDDT